MAKGDAAEKGSESVPGALLLPPRASGSQTSRWGLHVARWGLHIARLCMCVFIGAFFPSGSSTSSVRAGSLF